MYFELLFFAYFLDFFFAEFEKVKYLKHPIILIGKLISFFEKKLYKDSIFRGFLLTIFTISTVTFIVFILSLIDNIYFQALLASFTISSKMLYESVKNVIEAKDAKYAVSMLVSRDTKHMSESDINKASIETYAENLSDAVVAPMFYLLFFGLVGAFIYKTINTLDSMLGYRNDRYENFGKVSAKLDDIANFIPSRITAILISLVFKSKEALKEYSRFGKLHDSPNAGHPISAMALSINIKLGGPTSYFGKIKEKAYFGKGEEIIKKEHVKKSLQFKSKFDIFMFVCALSYFVSTFY